MSATDGADGEGGTANLCVNAMTWYFFFFFLSGFCSILYELVWLRLTMAQYGVTTPLVSITLKQ